MCEKCDAARNLIQTWLNQQGHDRCWYYPEVFNQLAALYNIETAAQPCLPPIDEFRAGCARYTQEEYFNGNNA